MNRSLKGVLTAGFAMFSTFFGSGNLVLPLISGKLAQANFISATIGFLLTAVLLPALGLVCMVFYKGDRHHFFSAIGKTPSWILTLALISLMGPVGIIPRGIHVAFGGWQLLYPWLPVEVFSILFCILLAWAIYKPEKVVEFIGIILTPFKLGGLLVLVGLSLYYAPEITPNLSFSNTDFIVGVSQGYQTMDLVGTFFFSGAIVSYLHTLATNEKQLIKMSFAASALGMFLLAAIYLCFVYIGAAYELSGISDASLFPAVINTVLGSYSTIAVSFVFTISCFATNVMLATVFVEFLMKDCFPKMPMYLAVLGTVLCSFIVSMLGFNSIATLLGTLLKLTYPAIVVYTLMRIIDCYKETRVTGTLFYCTGIISLLAWLFFS